MNSIEFWQLYNSGERNFKGANLINVNFDGNKINGIDLREAILENINISGSTFYNSNFSGANFRGATFYESSFWNTKLRNTNFFNLEAVDLNFEQCEMRGAILTNAKLGDVFFVKTNLTQSKWEGSSWCGGVSESNFTNALMVGLEIGHLEFFNTILPNGNLMDEIFDGLIIDEDTFSSEKYQTHSQISANLIETFDDLGTDYSKLNNLLSDKKWTAANRETMRLICKIIGQKFPDIIEVSKISDFPCSSLRTIDQLWMRYSWGHFGITNQCQAWKDLSQSFKFDNHLYSVFCNRVGWVENESFQIIDKYIDEKSIKSFPKGHLPAIGLYPYLYGGMFWGKDYVNEFVCLYHRLQLCQ